MSKVMLNIDVFAKALKDKHLTDSDAAKEMGIDRSHLYRVLKGKQDPGRKFIEGALKLCDGYSLNDLFFFNRVGTIITNSEQQTSSLHSD